MEDTEENAGKVALGDQLRQAREALGLSREDVATQLKLDVARIQNLEDEDISSIAAPVFLSGYLRAYAHLLNLSEDDLSDDFDALVKMSSSAMNPAASTVTNNFGRISDQLPAHMSLAKRSWKRLGRVGVVVVALIIVGGLWWNNQKDSVESDGFRVQNQSTLPDQEAAVRNEISDTNPVIEDLNNDVAENEISEILLAQDTVQNTEMVDDAEPIASGNPDMPENNNSSVLTAQQNMQETEGLTEQARSSENLTSPGVIDSEVAVSEASSKAAMHQDQLTFTFSQDSWVEVNDSLGQRLAYRLGKAGEVNSVSGMAPFSVRLGFVQGVNVSMNGEPYDLSRFANRRSVHFQMSGANDEKIDVQ